MKNLTIHFGTSPGAMFDVTRDFKMGEGQTIYDTDAGLDLAVLHTPPQGLVYNLEFSQNRDPLLEVLTRTFGKRPTMLARNCASLQAQTSPDWIQTLLYDEQGRGVEWAQENMANYSTQLRGEYVWILDDDDECIYPSLVQELAAIVADHNPDVIMANMEHTGLGVLPGPRNWGERPTHGQIGCSAYIVRREVWQAHAAAFIPGVYHSDFVFIGSVFDSNPSVYWWDIVASRTQRRSYGKGE